MARSGNTTKLPTVPRGIPRKRPGPVHEALMASIREIVREEIDPKLPIMGTVTGKDGGRLKIHVDDEDESRIDGFPKKLGQRYANGDRVLLVPSRAGEYMVAGTISSADGVGEKVVGNQDLEDDSVDDKKLKRNSVTGGQNGALAGSAVDTNNVKERAITPGKLSKDYADKTHPHNDLAGKDHNHNQDYAAKNHTHSGGVDAEDLRDLESDIQAWVRKNFEPKRNN